MRRWILVTPTVIDASVRRCRQSRHSGTEQPLRLRGDH